MGIAACIDDTSRCSSAFRLLEGPKKRKDGDPEDHVNRRILHIGSKDPDKGDSRNHGL